MAARGRTEIASGLNVLTGDAADAASLPLAGGGYRPRLLGRRLFGVALLTGAATAFLAYMVENVPLVAPMLSRAEAHRFLAAAVIGAAVVLAVVVLVVAATLRRQRAPSARGLEIAIPVTGTLPRFPHSLGWQRVPRRAVAIAAALSALLVAAAAVGGYPLWVAGVALAVSWLPLVAAEVTWKYRRYGIFAVFATVVLLQILHMGEHSMQVGQLLVSQGDLASSHGVFGQLDFELVHFVTDTTLWLTLALMLVFFFGRNPWLWAAFAAASLHQVEHFYLFWLNRAHESVYEAGGFAGIMGEGGMVGSPLDRPYLHFTYNLIVVVPMAIALWDEARRVDARDRAGAAPSAPE